MDTIEDRLRFLHREGWWVTVLIARNDESYILCGITPNAAYDSIVGHGTTAIEALDAALVEAGLVRLKGDIDEQQ